MTAPTLAGPVAVLLSRFPLLTETFILREVEELERQGQPVVLVPLLRERAAVVHPEARPWVERALYTPFLSPRIAAACLRALRRPRTSLAVAGRLVLAHARSPNLLLRTLALLPKSVYLAERLREEGVRHLHAHYATHPATAALAVSALAGMPWSMTVHAHDLFVRRTGLGPKLRRARFVRAVSRFNREFLSVRWPEAAAKVEVVHVGVDPARYDGARGIEPTASAGGGPPRLLCVAALKPYKGHAVLVEACARLRDEGVPFACDLIGEGPLRQAIERQIAALGLADRVRLAGALPQEEVARRLRDAAVVVQPSVVAADGQMEGIPVALMEAMAAGRPVVASRLSGVPELVEHEVNGLLVPPGDAAPLAAALRRLLAAPALREELGRSGRATVEREFRLDRSVGSLRALLDRDAPAPDPDLVARLAASTWPPFENGHVGLRRLHRREDSWVAELLLAAADGAPPREVVLKVQRSRPGESYPAPARARREFEALRCLGERLGGAEAAFGVPRALHLDESAAAVVMASCRGRPLTTLVREGRTARHPERRAALDDALRRTGGWLAAFQRATADAGDAEGALAALLDRARRELAACRGRELAGAEAERLDRRLATLGAGVDPTALRLAAHHGDFWPGNVFVAPGRVEVIDFEGIRLGMPEEDAASFLVELELFFAWPGLARRFRVCAAAFLASLADLDRRALELCRLAKGLQVLACGPPSGGLGGRRRRAALRRRLLAEGA